MRKPLGFSDGSAGKESASNAGDTGDLGSIPGSERSPGGGYGNPLQYSCWENSHGQKSLVGHSLWGHKELDTTEAWQGVPHTEESTKFLTLSYLVFLN